MKMKRFQCQVSESLYDKMKKKASEIEEKEGVRYGVSTLIRDTMSAVLKNIKVRHGNN